MDLLADLDDWEVAGIVLANLDYEAQFIAIRSLLRRQRQADADLKKEMDELESFAKRVSGASNERAVEEWGVNFHASIFQDAAHSMAAVGMLAPFLETIFHQSFIGIRGHLTKDDPPDTHARWQMAIEEQWDCHFVWRRGHRQKNLVEGIIQLAEACGLLAYLPNDLKCTLQALFQYRNFMFHYGFEWPASVRADFKSKLADWPADWFTMAMSDGKPWVFYVSDAFIHHCLTVTELILKGIGAFARAKIV